MNENGTLVVSIKSAEEREEGANLGIYLLLNSSQPNEAEIVKLVLRTMLNTSVRPNEC